MSSRFRFSFLPVFFVALTVVLAVAVFLRIRSYDDAPPASAPATATTESIQAETATAAGVPAPDTMETRVRRGFGTQVLSTQMEFNADPDSPAISPPRTASNPAPSAPVPVTTPTGTPATTRTEPASKTGPRSVNVTTRPSA